MSYKHGNLSHAALSCGYCEKVYVSSASHKEILKHDAAMVQVAGLPWIEVTFWMESEHYHIRAHEFNGRGRLFWDVYDSGDLTKARACFRRKARELTACEGVTA